MSRVGFVAALALAAAAPVHEDAMRKAAVKRAAYEESIRQCGEGKHLGTIVHLDEEAVPDPHSFKKAVLALGNAHDSVAHVYTTVANGIAGVFSQPTITELLENMDVESLQADCLVELDDPEVEAEEPADSVIGRALGKAKAKMDVTTKDAITWGLDRIDDVDKTGNSGGDGTYDVGTLTGLGARVYVLDTGIFLEHPDFGGRAIAGYSSGCPTGTESACTSADNEPAYMFGGVVEAHHTHCNDHGTHCASTAGGTTYGVAKGATLVSVQVLSCGGSGSTSGVTAGIDWAVGDALGHGMPSVISMSLGGQGSGIYSAPLKSAVDQGVVVSVAAGNSDEDACGFSPASTPEAITVMATDNKDRLASFSNFGSCADIAAPGKNIEAATGDGSSGRKSGTSMACPHVSGVAALIRAEFPHLTATETTDAILCLAKPGEVTIPNKQSPSTSPNKMLYITGDLVGTCGLQRAPPYPPSAPPTPPADPPPVALCLTECNYSGDTDCDDGGPDSAFSACNYGTDCLDCGPRYYPPSAPPPGQAPTSGGGGDGGGGGDSTTYTYERVTNPNKSCEKITTMEECQAAAAALGLPKTHVDPTPANQGANQHPSGCYKNKQQAGKPWSNRVFFDTNDKGTKNCVYAKQCICRVSTMRAKHNDDPGSGDEPDEEDKPDQCGGKSGCVQPEKAAMRAKHDDPGSGDGPDEEDKPDQCGGKDGCVQPEKVARRMAKLAAIREAKAKHALIPAA